MRIKALFITAALTSGILTFQLAIAEPESGKNTAITAPQPTQQALQLQGLASQILGNISIANIALAHGMNDDASSHITAARKSINTYDEQMTSSNTSSTPMVAGKMTYKTALGTSDYWIPVLNDRFVVRTLDGRHLESKNPDVDVNDAQTVHFKMLLDTKVADEQLARAQNAIGQKQYDVAMNALQNISKGAISEVTVTDKPMEAARENLILSRELLQDKDYRGASFSLKHANMELSRAQKDNLSVAENAAIKNMQAQIDSLQTTIAKNDPSMLKTAEMKIDGWIKDMKEKIHT